MRAVPRYVVEADDDKTEGFEVFSDEELANNVFETLGEEANQAQRHRNYFTMIYSSDGRLLVGRDVLIRDDDLDEDPLSLGDITGMMVGYNHTDDEPTVDKYYCQDDKDEVIDPTGNLPVELGCVVESRQGLGHTAAPLIRPSDWHVDP